MMELKSHKPSWIAPKRDRTKHTPPVSDTRKFHNSRLWRNYSQRRLMDHPACERCASKGIASPGKVTDHVVRISAGGSKMDPRNHRTLCERCHNSKSSKERAGFVHPWKLNEDGEKIPR